jgi:hypothetical protein
MTIRDGQDLRKARDTLGLTLDELGQALRLRGSRSQVRKRITAMECGHTELTGPLAVAVELMLKERRKREDPTHGR